MMDSERTFLQFKSSLATIDASLCEPPQLNYNCFATGKYRSPQASSTAQTSEENKPQQLAVTIDLDIKGGDHRKQQAKRIERDVVLVIDVSGSMSGAIPMLQLAIKQLAHALEEGDRVALVTFHSRASLLFPLQCLESEAKLSEFDSIVETKVYAQGSTNMRAGVLLGISS